MRIDAESVTFVSNVGTINSLISGGEPMPMIFPSVKITIGDKELKNWDVGKVMKMIPAWMQVSVPLVVTSKRKFRKAMYKLERLCPPSLVELRIGLENGQGVTYRGHWKRGHKGRLYFECLDGRKISVKADVNAGAAIPLPPPPNPK